MTIGVDRPWAEWMGSSHFQLGPLHLCDYLLRADIGLSGVAIEISPGYSPPGSHLRDLFEFSKLLDLYSLLNVPLHIWMALPSAQGPTPMPISRFRCRKCSGLCHQTTIFNLIGRETDGAAVAKPFVRHSELG